MITDKRILFDILKDDIEPSEDMEVVHSMQAMLAMPVSSSLSRSWICGRISADQCTTEQRTQQNTVTQQRMRYYFKFMTVCGEIRS